MLNNVFKNLHESYENFIWMIGEVKQMSLTSVESVMSVLMG